MQRMHCAQQSSVDAGCGAGWFTSPGSLWQMTVAGSNAVALADNAIKPGNSACSAITKIASEAILRFSEFRIGSPSLQ